jgi:phosphoserine phosphatase
MELENTTESQTLNMDPGDVLVLLSDGIYEYESKQGVPLGEERVGELLKDHHRLPVAKLSKQLLSATYEHGEGVSQQDDITLVLIRRLPGEK